MTSGATEFRLPDRLRDLVAAEARLKDEFNRRRRDYMLVRANLPANTNPTHTPACKAMVYAHRRWQFAYEKRKRLEGAPA